MIAEPIPVAGPSEGHQKRSCATRPTRPLGFQWGVLEEDRRGVGAEATSICPEIAESTEQ